MATDRSATATYRGTGLTCSGWAAQQEKAEDRIDGEVADLTAGTDGEIRLEGLDGENEAFGNHAGDRVANLNVTRVSNPARCSGLPSSLTTSPLSSGRRGK